MYEAQSNTELSFAENEYVGIIEDYPDGWSLGELNGVEGIFPTSYAKRTEDQSNAENDVVIRSNQH